MLKEYWEFLNTKQRLRLIFTILGAVLLLVFAFQNWVAAPVSLIFVRFDLPITVLIITSLVIGFMGAKIFNYRKLSNLAKEVGELKGQLNSYKMDKRDSL
jgi:uncharacterized integral membrane protein